MGGCWLTAGKPLSRCQLRGCIGDSCWCAAEHSGTLIDTLDTPPGPPSVIRLSFFLLSTTSSYLSWFLPLVTSYTAASHHSGLLRQVCLHTYLWSQTHAQGPLCSLTTNEQ